MKQNFFIPTQGTHILSEQDINKQKPLYDSINSISINEKYNNFTPCENLVRVIQNNGKEILEALNENTYTKNNRKTILDFGIKQLEMEKPTESTKNSLQEQLKQSKKKKNTI